MSENNEKPKKKIPEDDRDYPTEEQGIITEKTEEQISYEMEIGERNEDVYSEEGRENLVEDDEISPEEEEINSKNHKKNLFHELTHRRMHVHHMLFCNLFI